PPSEMSDPANSDTRRCDDGNGRAGALALFGPQDHVGDEQRGPDCDGAEPSAEQDPTPRSVIMPGQQWCIRRPVVDLAAPELDTTPNRQPNSEPERTHADAPQRADRSHAGVIVIAVTIPARCRTVLRERLVDAC